MKLVRSILFRGLAVCRPDSRPILLKHRKYIARSASLHIEPHVIGSYITTMFAARIGYVFHSILVGSISLDSRLWRLFLLSKPVRSAKLLSVMSLVLSYRREEDTSGVCCCPLRGKSAPYCKVLDRRQSTSRNSFNTLCLYALQQLHTRRNVPDTDLKSDRCKARWVNESLKGYGCACGYFVA